MAEPTPKLLFKYKNVPDSDTELSTGPATGYRWIITALYVTNKGSADEDFTLIHRAGANSDHDIELIPGTEIAAYEGLVITGVVIANGESVRATAGAASAFDVVAYGLEEATT